MYIKNKLLMGVDPLELVQLADELLTTKFVIVDEFHIHEDGIDEARILSIEWDEIFIVTDGLSGGRMEDCWNNYVEEFDSAYEALNYALSII